MVLHGDTDIGKRMMKVGFYGNGYSLSVAVAIAVGKA
jgi:hypothetical protein